MALQGGFIALILEAQVFQPWMVLMGWSISKEGRCGTLALWRTKGAWTKGGWSEGQQVVSAHEQGPFHSIRVALARNGQAPWHSQAAS